MKNLVKYIRSVIDPYIVNLKSIIESLSSPKFNTDNISSRLETINTNLNGNNGHIKDTNNPHKETIDQVAHVGSTSPTNDKKVWFNFL